jgi:hypothetical protein
MALIKVLPARKVNSECSIDTMGNIRIRHDLLSKNILRCDMLVDDVRNEIIVILDKKGAFKITPDKYGYLIRARAAFKLLGINERLPSRSVGIKCKGTKMTIYNLLGAEFIEEIELEEKPKKRKRK